MELDVSEADGFARLAARVGRALSDPSIAGVTDSGWLLGAGWSEGGWGDRRPATLDALDHATGARPVALHSADLHAYWLNTAAITRLGLDPEQAPDGLVREAPAFAIQHEIERSIQDVLESRIGDVLQQFLAVGITSIHDIDNHLALDAFCHLAAARALPLRVHKLTTADELELVTHEIGFAREVADSLTFIDDGVVVERGVPRDVLSNPSNERTRRFLSKVL